MIRKIADQIIRVFISFKVFAWGFSGLGAFWVPEATAQYPAFSTAEMTACVTSGPDSSARSVLASKLTSALSTPETLFAAFSTLAAQAAQVMPVMSNFTFIVSSHLQSIG